VTLGAIAVVVVLVVCGGGFAILLQIGRAADTAGRASSPLPSVSLPPGSEPSPLPSLPKDFGAPVRPNPSGKIGDPVRYAGFEFTVREKPACTPGPAGPRGKQVMPKQGQFCTVKLHVTNKTAARQVWLNLGAAVYTANKPSERQGGSVDTTTVLPYDELAAVLQPGKSANLTAMFDLAAGDTIEYVALSDTGFSPDPVVVDVR
jgi:hypothetical protein